MKNKKLFNAIVKISLLSTILAMSFQVLPTNAAALTLISDTMSRLKIGTAANHSIVFTSPSGATAGQTIKIQFDPATDAFNLGALAVGDMTVTGMTLVANVGACGAGGDEVYPTVDNAAPDENVTFTVCAGDTVPGGVISVALGNNIVINPAVAGPYLITIGGTMADSGSLALSIINDDQVVITATIDPTFTFALSQNAVDYGSILPSAIRYGTSPAGSGGTGVEAAAHNFTVATNATSGYTVVLIGKTLTHTDTVNTITAIGAAATALAFGSEQFGIRIAAAGGSGAAVAPYNHASNYALDTAVTDTVGGDQIASAAGPSTTTTFSVFYGADVSATTQAGGYSTTFTYLATGTF